MSTETDTTYNGWKNYETWNVNLWIANDPGLYSLSLDCENYAQFVDMLREASSWEAVGDGSATAIGYQTPDGVAWNDSGIDVEEIDRVTFDHSDA